MIYNFKEYKTSFDTPMRRQQELAISRKIMDLLNKNKYDDLEEFITKNSNYQDFLRNNNMETVVKHFGNTLKENDYAKILENLRVLTKTKKDFEKDNIKTTNINDKQYTTFKGEDKTYFIDNSRSEKSIEEQMKDLQTTQQDFQTSNQNKNTENMFKELETRKEILNLNYLNQINYELLNDEEKVLFQIANDYQQNIDGTIRVDLKKGVIVDELNEIMKIEKNNGEFTIIKDENGVEKEEVKEKTFQKTLTPNRNTIYSN
ncbi:MAG: hypothetical protein E7174_01620 [Firmicutes bacterium]|nr:hypothetical protein [Bacillota bacterium]